MKIWRYSDFPDEDIRFHPILQALGKNNFCFDGLWGNRVEPRNFDVELVETSPTEITLKLKLRVLDEG